MNIKQLGKLKYIFRGFTLIELMISMVIGLIILSVVLTMFVSMVKSDSDNMKSIRLNQELRAAMSLITRNIRRAGANQNSAVNSITTPPTNPFQGLTRAKNEQGMDDTCVIFSYDANDGSNELYGYRFDFSNKTVETRKAGAVCNATSNWEAITDEDLVTITDLSFLDMPVIESGVTIRQVGVTLSGELARDDTVKRTLTEIIKIRNDEI